MTPTERNYGVEDRELLAIMNALKDWRHFLLGTKEPFEIWTDHQNLQYFKKPQKVNRRQARWFTELADYHFTIHHIPGNTNVRADALSRRADYAKGEDDNQNITLLPEHFFRALVEEGSEDYILSKIAVAQRKFKAFEMLSKDKSWSQDLIGIIRNRDKIFVPNDQDLIGDILWTHHDTPIAGHPGQFRTQELIM